MIDRDGDYPTPDHNDNPLGLMRVLALLFVLTFAFWAFVGWQVAQHWGAR